MQLSIPFASLKIQDHINRQAEEYKNDTPKCVLEYETFSLHYVIRTNLTAIVSYQSKMTEECIMRKPTTASRELQLTILNIKIAYFNT